MDILDFESAEEYAEKMMAEKRLLNPRIDSIFKALFTQPTPESRGALKAFLEAATEKKIAKTELLPSSAKKDFRAQRDVEFDIMCTFDNGQQANIEMQAFKQKYDYGNRAEYHVARILSTGMEKGFSWQKVSKAYQISVLDFVYDDSAEDIVSRYEMRTKDGRTLKGMQNIVFIELPKIRKKEMRIETNTALENWAIFLKEADNPQKIDFIHELARKEEGLMLAQQSLSSISDDRAMWLSQFRKEVAEIDRRSILEAQEEDMRQAREKGLAEGRALGIQQGIAQGIAQGMQQGIQKGIAQGASRVLALNNVLIAQNRFEDLRKASESREYLEKLFAEFNL